MNMVKAYIYIYMLDRLYIRGNEGGAGIAEIRNGALYTRFAV